jgi:hypothetical protein
LVYLGFLLCPWRNFSAWRASLAVPVSHSPKWTMSHLKYRAVGRSSLIRWVINLRRTFWLLPMYMTDFLALASSYAPSFCDSFSKFVRVNLCHLAFIGILPLQLMIDASHRLAYPLAKRLEGITNGIGIPKGDGKNGK